MATPTGLHQNALANDISFKARVKFNLETVAFQVLNEDPATVGHSTRADYARKILNGISTSGVLIGIDTVVSQVSNWLVTRGNLLAETTSVSIDTGVPVVSTTASDAAIQSQLSSDWGVLSGAQ